MKNQPWPSFSRRRRLQHGDCRHCRTGSNNATLCSRSASPSLSLLPCVAECQCDASSSPCVAEYQRQCDASSSPCVAEYQRSTCIVPRGAQQRDTALCATLAPLPGRGLCRWHSRAHTGHSKRECVPCIVHALVQQPRRVVLPYAEHRRRPSPDPCWYGKARCQCRCAEQRSSRDTRHQAVWLARARARTARVSLVPPR